MDNTELCLSQMRNISDTLQSSREDPSLAEEESGGNVFEAGRQISSQVPSTSLPTTTARKSLEVSAHSDNERGGGVGGTNNVSGLPDHSLVEGASNADRSSSHPGLFQSPERRSTSVARSSHNQSGARKRVRAEMVVRDNEVILEISGLDKWGIDPNNIKVVDSLDAEDEEVEEEEGGGSHDRLKKLKLISVARHEKNFMRDGIFGEKFRSRYTNQV